MFGVDDLLPCAQCDEIYQIDELDENNICAYCAHENAAVSEVLEDAPDWLNNSPAWWSDSTSFSS